MHHHTHTTTTTTTPPPDASTHTHTHPTTCKDTEPDYHKGKKSNSMIAELKMLAMTAVSAATFHPDHYVVILAHGLRHDQHGNPDATIAGLERFIQELCPPPALRKRIQVWDPFVDFIGMAAPLHSLGASPKVRQAAMRGVAEAMGLEQSFTANYLHSSVNGVGFEQGCFQRFFWILTCMHYLGIESVLFIDGDILVLGDLFEAFGIPDDLKAFFRLSPSSTYFSVWSIATLTKFCSYIASFYNRPIGTFKAPYKAYQ